MTIRMSTNEKKSIKFDIAIAGTDVSELKGKLKIKPYDKNLSEAEVKAIATVDKIEYGLPIKINIDKTIEAEIPPLDEFIKTGLLADGSVLKATLEIIAGDTYMVPWEDTISVEVPVAVEATVTETNTIQEKKKLSISVKNMLESTVKEGKPKEKVVVKDKPKSRFGKTLG